MAGKKTEFSEGIRIGFKKEDMEQVARIRAVCVGLGWSDRDFYLLSGARLISAHPELADARTLLTSRELIEYAYKHLKLHFSREHIYTYRKYHWKEGEHFFKVEKTGRAGYVFDRDAVTPFLKKQVQAKRRYQEGREVGETEDRYLKRQEKEAQDFEDDGPRVTSFPVAGY